MSLVKRRPQVAVDLLEYCGFLAMDSLEAALRFIDAAEGTFVFVAKNPEIGSLCGFKSIQAMRVRSWPIKGFEKCLMFYEVLPDGVDVIRVLHGARNLVSILEGIE